MISSLRTHVNCWESLSLSIPWVYSSRLSWAVIPECLQWLCVCYLLFDDSSWISFYCPHILFSDSDTSCREHSLGSKDVWLLWVWLSALRMLNCTRHAWLNCGCLAALGMPGCTGDAWLPWGCLATLGMPACPGDAWLLLRSSPFALSSLWPTHSKWVFSSNELWRNSPPVTAFELHSKSVFSKGLWGLDRFKNMFVHQVVTWSSHFVEHSFRGSICVS